MSEPARTHEDEVFVSRAVEAAIRIGLLVVLVGFCLEILRPFVVVVLSVSLVLPLTRMRLPLSWAP